MHNNVQLFIISTAAALNDSRFVTTANYLSHESEIRPRAVKPYSRKVCMILDNLFAVGPMRDRLAQKCDDSM